MGRPEKSTDRTIRSLFFMATHTQPDSMWPTFCHKKSVFRATFSEVYVPRGERLRSLRLVEKGDKVYIDWKLSGVFVFADPEGVGKMTQVTHIGGDTAQLSPEDQFDKDKAWEVLDNWCELRAQLKVGKAVTKILDLFGDTVRDKIQKELADNKEYLQRIANDKNNATEDNECGDADSSVPSAASAPEAPTAPAPKRVRLAKAPPPKPEGGKVRAKRAT